MGNLEEIVSYNLKLLMQYTRTNQSDISKVLGVSKVQVSRRFNGIVGWKISDLEVLGTYYNIDPMLMLSKKINLLDLKELRVDVKKK